MSDRLRDRVTVRLSADHIAALDGLVAAGVYPNRSAALRTAVESLLTRKARLIVETGSEPTRRHLPDGEGGSLCTRVDNTDLTRLSNDRCDHLMVCPGCDPAVNTDRRSGGRPTPTSDPTGVSTNGHE